MTLYAGAMRQQTGFTIIELVISIVIIGIMFAVALPFYSDFKAAARYGKLKQTSGAVIAATSLVHTKAILQNQLGATGQVTMEDGTTIDLVFGYPAASQTGIKAAIKPLDFPVNGPIIPGGATNHMEFMVINQPYATNRCYFNYYEASSTTDPQFVILADQFPLATKGAAGISQCVD
jgi:prepilin-type N-terminal cleavage/methylation domain-containing protein